MSDLAIIVGASPVAVRQSVTPATTLAGVAPSLAGVDQAVVTNAGEIYKYGDDATRIVAPGDAGGEFAFGLNEAVLVLEIHLELGASSVVDVTTTDADGTHPRKLLSAQSGVADTYVFSRNKEVYLLPGQKIQIKETAAGTPAGGADKFATIYVAKSRRL
ncbi:MAG: hypothetical protein DRJ03_07690 [Chloroflexi bacterium]|nr:MAG: hypothetical protein DRJ03_07690 [Chloroflexota bacterium]